MNNIEKFKQAIKGEKDYVLDIMIDKYQRKFLIIDGYSRKFSIWTNIIKAQCISSILALLEEKIRRRYL